MKRAKVMVGVTWIMDGNRSEPPGKQLKIEVTMNYGEHDMHIYIQVGIVIVVFIFIYEFNFYIIKQDLIAPKKRYACLFLSFQFLFPARV